MRENRWEERIRGCLIGATIGAELGYARWVEPGQVKVEDRREIPRLRLRRVEKEEKEPAKRIWRFRPQPLLAMGVDAYRRKKGRVMPEEFGALFARSPAVSYPSFSLDGLHTTQEVLREGMQPRISGLGNAPCGILCAAMPAVGVYHFADPERAYLDGVELASVNQPRNGADWAGLCAAAVAAALAKDATIESVIQAVLKLAHRNNKDLFYEINQPLRTAEQCARTSDEAFLDWWVPTGSKTAQDRRSNWIAHNPVRYALAPLCRFGDRAESYFAVLLTTNPGGFTEWLGGGHSTAAVIGGAVLGALHGPGAFPAAWRAWAEPLARPGLDLVKVVRARLARERAVITVIETSVQRRRAGRRLLHEKIYGNILAGAIGNAMGSPVEGRLYYEVDREYPRGIRTVLQPERLEGEDDNQMAMLLTETYLERDGLPVMARHFGRTWKERLNRDHFYVNCMGNAYDLIRKGWDPRITGHWSVVTGSTVMCMEPVGMYNIGDPESAFLEALAISYMYQRGLDALVAANMAATVAEAMRPEATVDSICRAALDTAPAGPLRTFDRRPFRSMRHYLERCLAVADTYDDVMKARRELNGKCLLYHHIDPLELWGLSLAMFKIARGDVRQAAIGGTNIGRDSDTIAGRAAMLAGTLRGAAAVPAEWVKLFPPETLAKIRRNAGRLADLIAGPRLAALRRRVDDT